MTSIIRSDAVYCEKVARRKAPTLSLASHFLPATKRRAAFALHAFCRSVIESAKSNPTDWKATLRDLQSQRRDLQEALDGRARGPVLREIRWAAREFDIPHRAMLDVVDTVSRNVEPALFDTWDELAQQCGQLAQPVSEIYAAVFGVPGGPRQQSLALLHGRTLGVAMHLTCMLRDMGEDIRRGRCLMPAEELERFALARRDLEEHSALAADPRWHRLMTFEIGRARSLYERSLPGITLLSADSQRCVAGCVIGYAAILDALEEIRYDSVSTRASVGTLARFGVMWEAFRYGPRSNVSG